MKIIILLSFLISSEVFSDPIACGGGWNEPYVTCWCDQDNYIIYDFSPLAEEVEEDCANLLSESDEPVLSLNAVIQLENDIDEEQSLLSK